MIPNQKQNQQPLQNLPVVSINKFKTLFIISVILLVLVIIVSIFLLLQNKNPKTESKIMTQTPTSSIKQDKNYCEFNGKKYSVNESFPINDICGNSCVCAQNLTFTCTNKTCVSTTTSPVISSTKIISPTITSSEINNWKTYSNIFNYSIKYPKEWVFREFPDTKDGAGFRPLNKPNELRYEAINITVMPRISNKNSSFEEYVKKYAINEADGRTNLASSQKIITESGLVGFKNIYNSARGKDLIITYFDTKNANNDTIEISLNDENYLDLYNQMITTFQSTY